MSDDPIRKKFAPGEKFSVPLRSTNPSAFIDRRTESEAEEKIRLIRDMLPVALEETKPHAYERAVAKIAALSLDHLREVHAFSKTDAHAAWSAVMLTVFVDLFEQSPSLPIMGAAQRIPEA